MDRNALFLALSLGLMPSLAHADPRDALLLSLGRCAALADAPQRRACYDRLAPRLQAQIATPAKVAAAPPPPPTKEEKESWFGLDNLFGGGEDKPQKTPQEFGEERIEKTPEQEAKVEQEEIDNITARLTDYAKNPYGKFTVFLDNGQIWQQLSADTGEAHFDKVPSHNKVKIERAFLGSYSMTISNNTKLFKVRRVK